MCARVKYPFKIKRFVCKRERQSLCLCEREGEFVCVREREILCILERGKEFVCWHVKCPIKIKGYI